MQPNGDPTLAHTLWLSMLETPVHHTLDSARERGRNLFMDLQDENKLTKKNLERVLDIHPHSPEIASILWQYLQHSLLPDTDVLDFERLVEKMRTSLKDHPAVEEGVCWGIYPLRAVIQLVCILVDELDQEGFLKEAFKWAQWAEHASREYDGAGFRHTVLALALKLRKKTVATKMLRKLGDDSSMLGVWLTALHHVVFHPDLYQSLLVRSRTLERARFTASHRPLITALEEAPMVLFCLQEPELLPSRSLKSVVSGRLSEAMHAARQLQGILDTEAYGQLCFAYHREFQGKIQVATPG